MDLIQLMLPQQQDLAISWGKQRARRKYLKGKAEKDKVKALKALKELNKK
jgi:hypothetical protein